MIRIFKQLPGGLVVLSLFFLFSAITLPVVETGAGGEVPVSMLPPALFMERSLYAILGGIALATLVSEDLACISAGLLASQGIIGFWEAASAAFLGILGGDLLLFLTGRWLGHALFHRPFKWLPEAPVIDRSARWLIDNGPVVILVTRFVPGTRLPAYLAAGALGKDLWRFLAMFIIAAGLWVPLLVGFAYLAGERIHHYFEVYRHYAMLFFVVVIAGLYMVSPRLLPLLHKFVNAFSLSFLKQK